MVQSAYCQENYVPGYIVNLKGDTLQGTVDYRSWATNPKKIFFRRDVTAARKKYTPADIKGFGVAGAVYESAVIDAEVGFPNLYTVELEIKKDTTFVEAVIRGPKSLYFYSRDIGKDQFYIKHDSLFELLVHKRFQREGADGNIEYENNRYLGQLSNYLRDCAGVQAEMKYVRYDKASLQNLFLRYYKKCAPTEIMIHESIEKTKIEIGPVAGLTLNTLKFSGDAVPYLASTDFKASASFSAGLFLEATLPAAQRKWSLYTELLYTSYKLNGAYTAYLDPQNQSQYIVTTTTIGLSYIKSNNMLRFQYPVGQVHFFINGGFSAGYVIHDTNHKKQEFRYYATLPGTIQEGTALDGIRQYELAYLLGLGAKLKKYSFEVRGERGDGMSEYSELKSTSYRCYFLLAYRIRP